ncbi:unnamed protein product [Heligmosomoides polygyrus]|uniref:Proliferating cell nuclear antigen n=1 Tax=Heligmosomoides polygyrus TaxID=6339 RepID=A0A183FNR0_HELPZ|nr:unnamed protein product [Heligmosomoides polygyrus]
MAAGDARMNQVHVLEVKKSHVRDLASILKAISFREECIGMHTGSGATLKMTYDGAGEPVRLILEEDGIVVDMNVQTLTTEEEFDASSSTVTLSVSADELSLTTTGEIGKAVTKFPRFSEQIERLDCAEPVVHQYPLSLIRKMSTAFAIANKVSLRCDSRGVLSCQFMVEQAERKQVYIEFYRQLHKGQQVSLHDYSRWCKNTDRDEGAAAADEREAVAGDLGADREATIEVAVVATGVGAGA